MRSFTPLVQISLFLFAINSENPKNLIKISFLIQRADDIL
jgi:hypothetical protein